MKRNLAAMLIGAAICGSSAYGEPSGVTDGSKSGAATAATIAHNMQVQRSMNFADDADFALVRRGLVEEFPDLRILASTGRLSRNNPAFAFLKGPAPATVNPSLWRNAQLNATAGLFKVVDHVYQVRGFDGTVMSIVEGDNGIIVVDPFMYAENAAQALAVYRKHRGPKLVMAVIYTHPHADHYGGVAGIVDPADVTAGKIQVLAPQGFMEDAVSEWVIAGPLMTRRAVYMAGALMPPGPEGVVDVGIGKVSGQGTMTLIAPTRTIDGPQTVTIDGVAFDFRIARNVEAPGELTFYLPQYQALCLAELANQSMHQLYTLRGAKVRDAIAWSDHLRANARDYGKRMKAVFVSHGWPHWEDAATYIEDQADMYQFIHDQTLRMANDGMTPAEIADKLKLPIGLDRKWYDHGYYGSVSHNAKGVYQYYYGWFDGNPANLDPYPPEQAATRYVAAMGGADHVIEMARKSYADGDYRWVVELMKQVIFADYGNRPARSLAADAMRQLGYQAENALWRNFYLSGALELEKGVARLPASSPLDQYAASLTMPMIFRTMAVRVDGPRAEGRDIKARLKITDGGEIYDLRLHNSVLTFDAVAPDTKTGPVVTMAKADLLSVLAGRTDLKDKDGASFQEMLGLLSSYRNDTALVTP